MFEVESQIESAIDRAIKYNGDAFRWRIELFPNCESVFNELVKDLMAVVELHTVEITNERDQLRTAIRQYGLQVMQTSGNWSLYDTGAVAKAEQAKVDAVMEQNIRLEAENKSLRNTVELLAKMAAIGFKLTRILPKTADGCAIYPGMKIYRGYHDSASGKWKVVERTAYTIAAVDKDYEGYYSSRELVEAVGSCSQNVSGS